MRMHVLPIALTLAAAVAAAEEPLIQYSVNNVVFGWNLAEKTISVDEIAPLSGPLSTAAEGEAEGETMRIPVSKDGRAYFRIGLPAKRVASTDLAPGVQSNLAARLKEDPEHALPLQEVMRPSSRPVTEREAAELKGRTWQYFRSGRLVDEGPLLEIKGLAGLYLANETPDVADLSPLADLGSLPEGRLWLDLSYNLIADVSALSPLKSCWWLYVAGAGLTNIAPLAELKELRALQLSENAVADLRPLQKLPHLKRLYLAQTGTRDLAALAPLKGLEGLDLAGNGIEDARVLAGLAGLEWLHLGGNKIADLTPLARLSNLRLLNLGANGAADLTPLAGLTNLVMLHLPANGVSNLAPLTGLVSLKTLNLGGNGIAEVAPLARLKTLETLHLNGNRIRDLTPLAGLENLRILNLAQNGIEDLTPLAGLRQLSQVYLFGNAITDLDPLVRNTRGLGKGDAVWLVGNPLSEEARAKQIPALRARGVDVHF